MKRYVAIGLLLVATEAGAIECGPIVRAVTIHQMRESIKVPNQVLIPHRIRLHGESSRLLRTKSPEEEIEFMKMSLEISRLADVMNAGTTVQEALGVAWLLTSLRDDMRDTSDKKLLNEQLSHYLADARNAAERAHPYIGDLLTRATSIGDLLTRATSAIFAGVAADIAKLRDAIGAVASDLKNCTPPPGSACRRSFDKPEGVGRSC